MNLWRGETDPSVSRIPSADTLLSQAPHSPYSGPFSTGLNAEYQENFTLHSRTLGIQGSRTQGATLPMLQCLQLLNWGRIKECWVGGRNAVAVPWAVAEHPPTLPESPQSHFCMYASVLAHPWMRRKGGQVSVSLPFSPSPLYFPRVQHAVTC